VNKRHIYILAACLFLAGSSLFLYKVRTLGLPLDSDQETEVWTVEAHVAFQRSSSGAVKARLRIPKNPTGFRIVNENFVSRGYGLTVDERGDGRDALWAVRRVAGKQSLYYRLSVYADPTRRGDLPKPVFPKIPQLDEPYYSAMVDLATQVREQSADIRTFTSSLLHKLNDPTPEENISLLRSQARTSLERAKLAVTLLAGARIPAEVLQCVELGEDKRLAEVRPMLAVHNGDEWIYFDPTTSEMGMPANLLPWAWGGKALVDVTGGHGDAVEFSVVRSLHPTIELAQERAVALGSRVPEFSLMSLPLSTQSVYGVIVMIPLGALLVVLLRNFVGIRTVGTFMPVLIAISFRETQLLGGLAFFTLIIVVGLSIRAYMEHLRLLLVPRLASVLTVVVILMSLVSIISHRIGVDTGLSVALFPMVILTMMIERMSVTWEELGARDAITEGIGTMLTAVLIYLVMGIGVVKHLFFVFPELMLLILSITLLAGRYTGFRLTEYRRFKALAAEK
jgi:hypothetical protein